MFKKVGLALVMGLLVWSLAACGAGSGNNSGSTTSAEAATIETAISEVHGVAAVKARYTVQSGMGSTVHVNVTADAGTDPLETVMTDALKAFAGAADGIKTTSSVSFQVTGAGEHNTINPTAVGLPQSPTVEQIIDFANSAD